LNEVARMRTRTRDACWLAAAIAAVVALPLAARADDSPVGRWKTYDDETNKAKSIVAIRMEGGKLRGAIESLFREPNEDQDPKCDKCEGAKKDQRIIGMEILWDLVKDDDEWSGGRIMDPENGKDYKCFIQVMDGGRRLKVRGYLGVSLFGRTQYWQRVQ
jgi:uncharacterized protein (DUF2147 family)